MYCPNVINRAICKKLHDFNIDETQNITSALVVACCALRPLVILDIANDLFEKSQSVLQGTSHKYIEDEGKSTKLKMTAIGNKLKILKQHFSEKEILQIEAKFEECKLELRYIIRGHFITRIAYNIYYNYLKQHGYTKTISEDNFYDEIVDACCISCNCDDTQHLREEISRALRCLTSKRSTSAKEADRKANRV